MRKLTILMCFLSVILLNGCISTAIDTTTDVAASVVKAPIKIAGAAIGAMIPEKKEDTSKG